MRDRAANYSIFASEGVRRPWINEQNLLLGRVKFVCAVVFFKIVLDLCYVFYMNEAFGMHYLTPMPIAFNPFRFIISYVLAIIPAAFVPHDKRDFNGIFFLIVLMFLYIPMTCMFGLDVHRAYTGMILALMAIGVTFSITRVNFTNAKLPIFPNGEKYAIFISCAFVGLFVLHSIVSGAIAHINLDISKVYEFRESAGETLNVGMFAYLNLWSEKIFNPFLLAIGIYRRNRLLIIGALVMQVFFFAVTQHRSHLFLPIVVFLASQLYMRRISISALFVWSGALLGALLVLTLWLNLETLPALIIRRAFFVPSSATFSWITFFSGLPKIHWSDEMLSAFIHTRYTGQSIPAYIGYYVSHGKYVAFNVGLVGTGYAQAGYFGVILYAVLLGFVVKTVNTMIHSGLPAFLPAALLVGPVRTAWADADVLTALLSHGILVGIIVMWLYGSQNVSRPGSGNMRSEIPVSMKGSKQFASTVR